MTLLCLLLSLGLDPALHPSDGDEEGIIELPECPA